MSATVLTTTAISVTQKLGSVIVSGGSALTNQPIDTSAVGYGMIRISVLVLLLAGGGAVGQSAVDTLTCTNQDGTTTTLTTNPASGKVVGQASGLFWAATGLTMSYSV